MYEHARDLNTYPDSLKEHISTLSIDELKAFIENGRDEIYNKTINILNLGSYILDAAKRDPVIIDTLKQKYKCIDNIKLFYEKVTYFCYNVLFFGSFEVFDKFLDAGANIFSTDTFGKNIFDHMGEWLDVLDGYHSNEIITSEYFHKMFQYILKEHKIKIFFEPKMYLSISNVVNKLSILNSLDAKCYKNYLFKIIKFMLKNYKQTCILNDDFRNNFNEIKYRLDGMAYHIAKIRCESKINSDDIKNRYTNNDYIEIEFLLGTSNYDDFISKIFQYE